MWPLSFEDIVAFNGVIHVIDEVLVPAGYPSATTWDVIEQSPDHIWEWPCWPRGSRSIGRPILNDNEPAEGPFTVFAPTDEAFYAFAEANGFASLEELMNSQFIDDIVRAYLVKPNTSAEICPMAPSFRLQRPTHQ